MKIVFVVYHDLKIEARSQETAEALKILGDVTVVTCAEPFLNPGYEAIVSSSKLPIIRYFLFLLKAKKTIKKVAPDVVCLHDCSLLVPYLRKRKTKIVYDQSELLIDRKVTSLKSALLKLIDYSDKRYIKKCDIVFTANLERAKIMQKYYCLDKLPIVFDNIHKIEDQYDTELCQMKYDQYIKKTAFNIVSGGGLWKERRIYELMQAVIAEKGRYNLIIVGVAPRGEGVYKEIKKRDKYN